MPPPALLILPAAGPAVAHAAAAAAPYATSLSSTTLAAVLARSLWKSLPEWVRNDPAFKSFLRKRKQNGNSNGGGGGKSSSSTLSSTSRANSATFTSAASIAAAQDENDATGGITEEAEEMATLTCVIRKLDEMVSSGSKKLGTKLRPAQLHAAVLAYVQLSNQLRVRNPDARDRLYSKSDIRHDGGAGGGEADVKSVSKQELQELRQSLDFATWSYVDYYGPDDVRAKLENVDYYLQSYKLSNVPGRVGHYVAISPERKVVLIGVKGTSTLEDLITDAAGKSVAWDMQMHNNDSEDGGCEGGMSIEVTDTDHETIVVKTLVGQNSASQDHIATEATNKNDGEEGIECEICRGENIIISTDGSAVRCHEGVLLCARRLAEEVRDVIQTLAVKCDYSVRIVGHSLGASVAVITAVLLRSMFSLLAERNAVHVHAFAPPPVLDVDGATACAPFVTSVVNNADIIPRGSVANLAVLLELLSVIDGKLEKLGMGLAGPRRAAALLRKLSQGTRGDMIMEWQEVRDLVDETHRKIDLRDPDHLFVPGRVILIYDPWSARGDVTASASKESMEESTEEPSTCNQQKEKQEEQQAVKTDGMVRCACTYGTAAPLRLFEVDALRMVTDHLTTSHEASLDCLIRNY